jgi:FKBP-type peptidyl-prolyl cis-trans isomerase SlyD
MTITTNSVVSIHYTLTDEDGVQIDSSEGQEPMLYLQGAGNIIPGLENALVGKAAGDSLTVSVPPVEGYGEYMDEMVQRVPREMFEDGQYMEVGMRFQASTDDGPISVIITEVTEEDVSVDANHPLAGKTLNFDVIVDSIREATEEELAHSHPHEEGGCGEH